MVINPSSWFWTLWTVFEGIFSISTAIIYPDFLAFGFPEDIFKTKRMTVIILGETLAFIDIIIRFFIAYKKENSDCYELSF